MAPPVFELKDLSHFRREPQW